MQQISTLLLAGACAPWVISVQALPLASCGKRADTASAEAAVMLTSASLLRPHRGRAVAASPGTGPRMGQTWRLTVLVRLEPLC